jgi:hypothetical protein
MLLLSAQTSMALTSGDMNALVARTVKLILGKYVRFFGNSRNALKLCAKKVVMAFLA